MCSAGPQGRVMLRNCLAITIRKEGCQGDPGDFWMYESGYLLFQGLLSANSVCWWSGALSGAARCLGYRGYVSPGSLLVAAEPCALEVLRGAWARRVLQPPAGYQIVALGDVEECRVIGVAQTQWTPLPEAICSVVLRLSSQGRPAGLESIRESLMLAFPHVTPPDERTLYDTLTQLTAERKLYHSSRGYFIVTPERRRSRSHSRGRRRIDESNGSTGGGGRGMLMSTEEALVLVHGDMATIRDGDVTHQCIQTNLADVICGGNPSDKILFARSGKRRSASFPAPRSPDRRGSFRLWSPARRLRRSASTRTLARHCPTDSSSSTEYPSDTATPKKQSLLTRLFRRSKRSQCQISTFSAQFPPTEWFNSKAIHLHSVATQTNAANDNKDSGISLPYFYDSTELSASRSATLPRRHRRQLSSESACATPYPESREQSPSLRHRSPSHASSTLPRGSTLLRSSSRKTSRSSLSPKVGVSNNEIHTENGHLSKALMREELAQKREASINSFNAKLKQKAETLKTSQTNKQDVNNSTSKLEVEKLHSTGSLTEKSSSTSTLQQNGISLEDSSNFTTKSSCSIENSGPSSIDSHKSSKTGSSLTTTTSGPSSLESHKTVIRATSNGISTDSQISPSDTKSAKKSPKRKEVSRSSSRSSPKSIMKLPTTTIPHSNSFTLQVTTNQNGHSYITNTTNAMTTATINGGTNFGTNGNTKIFVQNSPVRSVITFENGQSSDPNVVIINGSEPEHQLKHQSSSSSIDNPENPVKANEPPKQYSKNTNTNSMQVKTERPALNNTKEPVLVTDFPNRIDDKNETMNNSRKLSLQLTPRDGLSYKNLIKNVPSSSLNQFSSNSSPGSPLVNSFRDFTRNTFGSNPPSPTKSYDSISGLEKSISDTKPSLEKSYQYGSQSSTNSINKIIEKNSLGSEPNLTCNIQDCRDKTLTRENSRDLFQFPSLTDLSFNFTSLTAQKLLKGVSINSIDTLVELNMAANSEKQNNCDIVHTDFGLV